MDLAAGFPSTDRDDWRALALAVLRKSGVEAATPEEALASGTFDGITVAPLYDAADLPGAEPFERRARADTGWDIRQRHALADPEAVLADLTGGHLALAGRRRRAIPVAEPATLLKDVYLDLAPITLDAGARTREAAEALFALADRTLRQGGSRAGGRAVLTGILAPRPSVAGAVGPAVAAELAARCAAEFPGLRAVTVDATPYHDAGASDAEELGCSIAAGVADLRALDRLGHGRERSASWSSATPPPPTSSPPSPSCAPPASCGPGSPRCAASGAGAAPARGDQLGHDDRPRPLGEHAPHHPRLLRRRGRRRRRGDRPALRRRASAAGRVLPPDRPQHPAAAAGGGGRRPGDRPGGRLLVRRAPHRRPGRARLGLVPGDRGGRRHRGGGAG